MGNQKFGFGSVKFEKLIRHLGRDVRLSVGQTIQAFMEKVQARDINWSIVNR